MTATSKPSIPARRIINRSAQIALMVAPLLVIVSHLLGTPMSLIFNPFEIAAIVLSVGTVTLVAMDGESNWLEGLQLPGLYVILVKWTPHHMSRPHFHPNDRYVTVISGTWWVGTGSKYDPDSTVPIPAGSFVTHTAKEIHYDGAKDGETVLEIVGMGPATSTPAEAK